MKVLILTCNTGGGHNAAAAALRRELESRGHTCAVAAITDLIEKGMVPLPAKEE